jgi:hypothetical protein
MPVEYIKRKSTLLKLIRGSNNIKASSNVNCGLREKYFTENAVFESNFLKFCPVSSQSLCPATYRQILQTQTWVDTLEIRKI